MSRVRARHCKKKQKHPGFETYGIFVAVVVVCSRYKQVV